MNNEQLAYDLALIYAKTKFDSINSKGIIGDLYPQNEPEAELITLATFFNDVFDYYRSHNISEIDDHNLADL